MNKNYYKIDYPAIGESVCCREYENGFKAYVIPKEGFSKIYACVGTHFGSLDNAFMIDNKEVHLPDGIAHFLEHKLFEQEDENVLMKYAKLGASPNAYTSFNKTVYLFSCTDEFSDCFKLLMSYIYNPYFTEENVEKEKGIIGQEIDMYGDDSDWQCYFNLIKALYVKHPVRVEIAGSKESIKDIDVATLTECHSVFYHPSNMVGCIVGDVDPEEAFDIIQKQFETMDSPIPNVKKLKVEEPAEIFKDKIEVEMDVAMPKFLAGFKDVDIEGNGSELVKREITMNILLEMMVGSGSELYERLYSEGLINKTFSFEYNIEEDYGFSCFGGDSINYEKVIEEILKEIERFKEKGIDEDVFKRLFRAHKGRRIKGLDSVEGIAHDFMSLCFEGVSMFDYFGLYDRIDIKYAEELLKKHFNRELLAASIVKPLGEK